MSIALKVSMPQAAYVRCNCTHVNPPWILNKNKFHHPHSITHFLICKTAAFIQLPEIRRLFASKCYSLFPCFLGIRIITLLSMAPFFISTVLYPKAKAMDLAAETEILISYSHLPCFLSC